MITHYKNKFTYKQNRNMKDNYTKYELFLFPCIIFFDRPILNFF